jgi:outer membrane receptor protein involved in Fe transport
VNVITKNTKEEPLTIAKIYGGIYSKPYYEEWDWSGEHRLFSGMTLSHSRRLDRLSFLLSLSRVQDEGYRENDYYRRLQGFAKFKYEFTPFVSWSVLLNALNQKSGNYYFWRDLRHALQPPENSLGELVNTTRWSIGSEFKHFVGERFFYTAKAILYRSDWKDNIGHPYSDSIGDHSTSDFVDFELQSNYQLDSSQVLTAGLDGTFNLVASNLFGDRSGFGAAAYTQYELKVVDALRLTLGIRLDYRKLDSLDANSQVNPKLGFVFDVCSGTAVRGSVGRGFRAPSIGEAFTSLSTSGIIIQPNPRLKPESSWSFEVGGTQRVSDYTVLDVALFQNEFWDLIQPKFLPNGRAVFDNVTRARIQGMEISARMGWFKKMINTELSYTYLYPRDVDLNEALKYRPRNLFYASANVDYGPIQIGADFRYMSKIENIDMDFVTLGIIRDGDQRGSAYVVDARLNFDVSYFGLPVFVGLNVNNMLQYNYVELIGNIAPIRNFVLTIEGRF